MNRKSQDTRRGRRRHVDATLWLALLWAAAAAPAQAQPGPLTTVSAASFNSRAPVAPGSIASAFGEGLATTTAAASTPDLPTELAGVRLTVTDIEGNVHQAPLFFVSPFQINFLVPQQAVLGTASVAVRLDRRETAQGMVSLIEAVPAIFTANASGSGAPAGFYLRVQPGGQRFQDLLFDPDTLEPVPIPLGGPDDEVFLLLFGTGMRVVTEAPVATIDQEDVAVLGPAPQGEFVGLDQINLGPLPRTLAGAGEAVVRIAVSGRRANNVVVRIE